MRVRSILRPGQKGTKQLSQRYGDTLLFVRYRYDVQRRKRFKTVELIVSEADWTPPPPTPETIVGVRVAREEAVLQGAIKKNGGRWDGRNRVWRLRYDQATRLNVVDRIVWDVL